MWVLNAARLINVFWILAVLNVLSTTVGGIVLFYGYHIQPKHRHATRFCWLAALGVLTAVLWFAGTAVFLPMVQLQQGLS